MKKLIWTLCLVMGFASTVYAASFCCGDGKTKEQCCAERGKMYCENDGTCRTRCKCESDECCGCINPEGVCCDWCPSAEVCQRMGKCQKIVDGCYTCDTCPPNCGSPKCLNQDGECCDSCPRTCPEGQCLVNIDGCYQCGECGECNPACTGGMVCCNGRCQTPVTSCEGCREPTADGCGCGEDQTTKKPTGECCDEGEVPCCPLEGTCECVPNAEICEETEPTEPSEPTEPTGPTEPTEPSEPTEPTGTDTGGGGTTSDGECGCGWFCGLLNEETVQPVANATVDTPLQHGITRDFSDCGRCVNWMFENRIVCQCNDGYTQVDIEGEDLDVCCPTASVCGEAENKVCCEEGEVCAEDKCCPEIKACGMGVDRVCCGEEEECVGGVCCPTGKKCGDSCCSAEQTCENGQCKCPTDKPKKCGESCCLIGCNSTNTGCKCPDGETECGSICCGVNETCSNGVCVCKDGREACAGVCCSEKRECHNGTTCCDIIDKTKCPNGETMTTSEGCEICKCNSPTSCPEGQELVTNYVNGIGACGEVCCGVKPDERDSGWDEDFGFWENAQTGWTNDGAINGTCCGWYTYHLDYAEGLIDGESSGGRAVRYNNGYYCSEYVGTGWYASDSKWCNSYKGETYCRCSSVGEPAEGEECE